MTAGNRLDVLEDLIRSTVAPAAAAVDRDGTFPRASIDALLGAGFGGLTSASEVGGAGAGFAEAAAVVRRLARACGSTAMVYTMHLAAAGAIEALGPPEARRAIARGAYLSTLAFSEQGSRSHFWAPLSTATPAGAPGRFALDAQKSWVTSAGEADSYVWTSRPVGADGAATLWLVPASTPGLSVTGTFDGLGLRGNASAPVTATGAVVDAAAMLGADGAGLDAAMAHVLPWFQVLTAAGSLGLCDGAITATTAHLTTARLEHLDQVLADQPVNRHHLGRLSVLTDAAAALVDDACAALDTGRADGALRMLAAKAVAAETALEVTGEAMRLAGGAAFRREVGVERYFRDARAASVMAPTTDALYDMTGRALCGMPLL